MKKDRLCFAFLVVILALILAGCANNIPATSASVTSTSVSTSTFVSTSTEEPAMPTISPTSDLCLSPQIETEAQKIQRHMREFDDASTLASSVPQGQLSDSIADLQRIRREADDEQIPACLTDLKNFQINHMNSVINTLLAFMRASDPRSLDCVDIESNTEEEAICQNIALARQQHDQYLVELARILGLTVVPATPGPGSTPAETASP